MVAYHGAVALGRLKRAALAGASLVAMAQAAAAQGPVQKRTPATPRGEASLAAPARSSASPVDRVRVSVPEGALEQGLTALCKQARLKLAYQTALTEKLTTRGVDGEFEPLDALARVLEGTGLSYRHAGTSTVTLVNPRYVQLADTNAGGAVRLEELSVTSQRGGQPPPTGTIGQPPAPYAGGQVATGGRLGLLGNRNIFDTPFSQTNYTEEFIRNQQARSISDVIESDPSVRSTSPRFADEEELRIRGFPVSPAAGLFNGLPGIISDRRPPLQGIERVEVLRGPSALLNNATPHGSTLGGNINLVPKRAFDLPLTRMTGSFLSDSEFGGHLDVGRRFGFDNKLGARVNLAGSSGKTAVDNNSQQFFVGTFGVDYRGDRWRASLDFGREDRTINGITRSYGLATGLAVPRAPKARRNVVPAFADYSTENMFGVVSLEYDILDDWTVFGSGGLRRSDNRYFGPIFAGIVDNGGASTITNSNSAFGFGNQSGIVGLRGLALTGPVKHQLSVSVDRAQRQLFGNSPGAFDGVSFATNIYDPAILPRLGQRNNSPTSLKASEQFFTSYAVADTLSVLDDRISLILGVRYQDLELRNFNTATGSQTDRYNQARPSPSVALVLHPAQNLTLYSNYIEDLVAPGIAPPNAANFGQQLPAAVGNQIEFGAKYDAGPFALTGAVFQITQPVTTLDPTTNIFSAASEQRNRGVELGILGEPLPGWRALGGVSFLEGTLTKTPGGVNDGRVGPGVPNRQISLGIEHDLAIVPGLTLMGRVVDLTSQFVDQANTQRIPGWTRYDVGARYGFKLAERYVVARFMVQNVFDRSYWAAVSDGQLVINTPRTFLLSLSADF